MYYIVQIKLHYTARLIYSPFPPEPGRPAAVQRVRAHHPKRPESGAAEGDETIGRILRLQCNQRRRRNRQRPAAPASEA